MIALDSSICRQLAEMRDGYNTRVNVRRFNVSDRFQTAAATQPGPGPAPQGIRCILPNTDVNNWSLKSQIATQPSVEACGAYCGGISNCTYAAYKGGKCYPHRARGDERFRTANADIVVPQGSFADVCPPESDAVPPPLVATASPPPSAYNGMRLAMCTLQLMCMSVVISGLGVYLYIGHQVADGRIIRYK